MNHPESPHQAAIAGTFKAKVRPPLAPDAVKLVKAYDRTYGSTSPGCCPEALAAVLDEIATNAAEAISLCGSISVIELVRGKAALLRGEQP